MLQYFILNTENMKALPIYLKTSGANYDESEINREVGFTEYLMLLTVSGEGLLEYKGSKQVLEKGCLILIPKHFPHSYKKITPRWKTHFISFDGHGLDDFFSSMIPEGIQSIDLGAEDTIGSRMIEINRLTGSDYQKNALKISSLIYSMVIEVVLSIQKSHSNKMSRTDYIEKVLDYMRVNYMKQIAMEDMTSFSGVSPQYLCRLFKEQLGVRPFEYLKQWRVNQSKQLLIENNHMKIEEIARAVGFNNPSYYGAVFKKYEKMTPKAFAKLHKRQ